MSRFDRTRYFDRLVELHMRYTMRGDDDRTSVMTIDGAVEWAEVELDVPSATDRDSDPRA